MIEINVELLFLISIPVSIVLVYFAHRKYRIFDTWINLIKKTGPLFLIFFPVIFTYLFVCGSFSAVTVLIFHLAYGKDQIDRDSFMMVEDCVEFACGFFMCLLYYRILSRNHFPFFWTILITLTHMLAAGYRDAKYIYEPAVNGAESRFESGPIILPEIQFLDTAIPLIAFLVFFFFLKKRWETSKIPELRVLET
jgi:hypothetical protein